MWSRLFSWILPERALRIETLTRGSRPWLVHFEGDVLDGQQRVLQGAVSRYVVPVVRATGRMETVEYRLSRRNGYELDARP